MSIAGGSGEISWILLLLLNQPLNPLFSFALEPGAFWVLLDVGWLLTLADDCEAADDDLRADSSSSRAFRALRALAVSECEAGTSNPGNISAFGSNIADGRS